MTASRQLIIESLTRLDAEIPKILGIKQLLLQISHHVDGSNDLTAAQIGSLAVIQDSLEHISDALQHVHADLSQIVLFDGACDK